MIEKDPLPRWIFTREPREYRKTQALRELARKTTWDTNRGHNGGTGEPSRSIVMSVEPSRSIEPFLHPTQTGATTGAQRGHFGDGPGGPGLHVLAEKLSRTPIAFAVGGICDCGFG